MGTSNTLTSSVSRVKVTMRRNRSGFGAAKKNIVNVRGTVVLLGCVAPAYPLWISEKFRVQAAGHRKHALGSSISFARESGCGT